LFANFPIVSPFPEFSQQTGLVHLRSPGAYDLRRSRPSLLLFLLSPFEFFLLGVVRLLNPPHFLRAKITMAPSFSTSPFYPCHEAIPCYYKVPRDSYDRLNAQSSLSGEHRLRIQNVGTSSSFRLSGYPHCCLSLGVRPRTVFPSLLFQFACLTFPNSLRVSFPSPPSASPRYNSVLLCHRYPPHLRRTFRCVSLFNSFPLIFLSSSRVFEIFSLVLLDREQFYLLSSCVR